jgi:tight adherence protein C
MAALFVIALLLLGVAIALVIRAVALAHVRMATHLRQIESYGFDSGLPGEEPITARPPLGWGVNALAERVGRYATARVGILRPVTTRELAAAGVYTVSPDAFHGYRLLAATSLPALVLAVAVARGGGGALAILLAALLAAASWVLLGGYVRRRGESRLNEIDRELPELIDVLTATLEAGLGFAGSLQLVADRFEGPLGSELKLTLQEQHMGLASGQALSNMLERCDSPAMRSFVRAVIQGETLGVSIGTMMRNLALEMRKRRRQDARERVQKAPVKMLFPLIFLIFPALLIVLLYPGVHEFLKVFSTG